MDLTFHVQVVTGGIPHQTGYWTRATQAFVPPRTAKRAGFQHAAAAGLLAAVEVGVVVRAVDAGQTKHRVADQTDAPAWAALAHSGRNL